MTSLSLSPMNLDSRKQRMRTRNKETSALLGADPRKAQRKEAWSCLGWQVAATLPVAWGLEERSRPLRWAGGKRVLGGVGQRAHRARAHDSLGLGSCRGHTRAEGGSAGWKGGQEDCGGVSAGTESLEDWDPDVPSAALRGEKDADQSTQNARGRRRPEKQGNPFEGSRRRSTV